MTNLIDLTLAEAAAAIRKGELDRREYADVFRENRERNDAAIHAFLKIDEGAAAEAPDPTGALLGIPIAIKDNIMTRGLETTCGSRMLASFIPPNDATVISRLRGAGAVVVGKTNLDEFAMGASTEHSAFGPTRNPWDPGRVPGGSSGGSAAAVAAGMVPAAIGSDTGGSVRQPAAFCGVLGLKPTYGRVSRSGLVAFASSLDQIGVLAKRAMDCAAVLHVIAGADPADATSSNALVPRYEEELGRPVAGVRIGVVRQAIERLPPDVRNNFETAVEVLRGAGAIVDLVSLPLIERAIATYYVVANAEASANLARFDGVRYGARAGGTNVDELYRRARSDGFGAEVKRRILLGTFALSAGYQEAYYARAQAVRQLMQAEFAAALGQFDLLATPTTPAAAFRLGEKDADPLSMYLSDVFTAPANLAGLPAIAIPSGFDREGLPLSLQLIAAPFAESLLLRAAHSFEQETGHWRARPRV